MCQKAVKKVSNQSFTTFFGTKLARCGAMMAYLVIPKKLGLLIEGHGRRGILFFFTRFTHEYDKKDR